jgi:CDP-glycerol glycerophosphotransferase (TagB/SpsB family)
MHIIERHRPALLISPDVNDPRTRIFCLAGRLAGVRTLDIQFSFYGNNDIEWRFFIADHLAVTGEANLRVMLDHGISREKMTVTGSPRYDSIGFLPEELTLKVRHDLKIPAGKVMVLFASQPYYFGTFTHPELRREMIQALFQAASKLDGLVLVVKPHPLEDPAELASLAKGRGNILFVDKGLDIRNLIKAADAFVTFFSNTTFDALVMNKPTINILFPGCCANNLFEYCGATFVARSNDDIARILLSICSGRSSMPLGDLAAARESFLKDWFHQLDGRAAERIEAMALSMASGEPSR